MTSNELHKLSDIKYGMEEIDELMQYYRDKKQEYDLMEADRKLILEEKNPQKLKLYTDYFWQAVRV